MSKARQQGDGFSLEPEMGYSEHRPQIVDDAEPLTPGSTQVLPAKKARRPGSAKYTPNKYLDLAAWKAARAARTEQKKQPSAAAPEPDANPDTADHGDESDLVIEQAKRVRAFLPHAQKPERRQLSAAEIQAHAERAAEDKQQQLEDFRHAHNGRVEAMRAEIHKREKRLSKLLTIENPDPTQQKEIRTLGSQLVGMRYELAERISGSVELARTIEKLEKSVAGARQRLADQERGGASQLIASARRDLTRYEAELTSAKNKALALLGETPQSTTSTSGLIEKKVKKTKLEQLWDAAETAAIEARSAREKATAAKENNNPLANRLDSIATELEARATTAAEKWRKENNRSTRTSPAIPIKPSKKRSPSPAAGDPVMAKLLDTLITSPSTPSPQHAASTTTPQAISAPGVAAPAKMDNTPEPSAPASPPEQPAAIHTPPSIPSPEKATVANPCELPDDEHAKKLEAMRGRTSFYPTYGQPRKTTTDGEDVISWQEYVSSHGKNPTRDI